MYVPLTDLLGSYTDWCWGPPQQSVFDTLKAALYFEPVLLIADIRVTMLLELMHLIQSLWVYCVRIMAIACSLLHTTM